MNDSNPLEDYFLANTGRQIHKWMHYFGIYDRHFSRFRGTAPTVVEFGVQHGGSLQMWREYFGADARIIGVDIDPRCRRVADPPTKVYIGDQGDRKFLRRLVRKIGRIDVVIEDGGHLMDQQIATFEELWPAVNNGGVYLVEDLHTSYWSAYGGGYRRPGTFIEYAKEIIDQINARHTEDPELFAPTALTASVVGMHVYDSIIALDKLQVPPLDVRMTGHPSFDP